MAAQDLEVSRNAQVDGSPMTRRSSARACLATQR